MGRAISLIDEIKMHILMWIQDDEYKKISPQLKQAITMAHNELKIRDMMIKSGVGELKPDQTPISKERRIFIAIFKQKYLQFIDLKYEKQLTPASNKVLTSTLERLLSQGSNSQQYLQWLWNDFFTIQKNKKYLPCDILFSCNSWIVDKFLYQKKDSLRVRKKDVVDIALKNKITELAVMFLQKHNEKQFGEKILIFSRGQMTMSKFVGIFNKFCQKFSENEIKQKLNEMVS